MFGLQHLLGAAHLWHYALALPIVPALLGSLLLLSLFPESPRALLLAAANKSDDENDDDKATLNLARKSLQLLRNNLDVEIELNEMQQETTDKSKDSSDAYTLGQLFRSRELRWPLLTGVLLNFAQQMSGVNAVIEFSFIVKYDYLRIKIFFRLRLL